MDSSPLKKVIIEVKGGLGNQMFQYAAGRAFSLELGAELFIESRLGFFLDRRYRSTFQLDSFPVSYSAGSLRDSLSFFEDRVKSFYAKRSGRQDVKQNSRNYLFERNFDFMDLRKLDLTKRRFLLAGYYQDPRYFDSHKQLILDELTPPTPVDQKYLELASLSRSRSLIAFGIRMYEDSSSPEAHARGGIIKTIPEYRLAVTKLIEDVANPLILVFTSKEFDFLNSLNLPADCIFVNPDRGFTDTIDTLWLMSNCRHHIFNNSTFYWWGAALSASNYNSSEQKIFYSDNFLNPYIGYPDWQKF